MSVACPLRSSYHFVYNENSVGVCAQPTSFVQNCASESQLQFRFKQCPGYSHTSERGKERCILDIF